MGPVTWYLRATLERGGLELGFPKTSLNKSFTM